MNPQENRHYWDEQRALDSESTLVTAAATLTPDQTTVYCKEPASSTYAITLPPVTLCRGKHFYIELVEADGGTVTVQDDDNVVGTPYASDALTAVGDFVLLYCTGRRWVQVAELTT